MKPVDPGNAMLPILHRMCTISKKDARHLQPRCKYYGAGKNGACAHLANWWSDGLQGCASEAAYDGYIEALKKEEQ
jgi:hypothetical protein